jgi:hypothetical protein
MEPLKLHPDRFCNFFQFEAARPLREAAADLDLQERVNPIVHLLRFLLSHREHAKASAGAG